MSASVSCIVCRGRGWVLVPQESGAGLAKRCECRGTVQRSDEEMVRVLQRAGMATDEIRSALKPWEEVPNGRPEKLDELLRWVGSVADGVEVYGQSEDASEPWSWLIVGMVGTGKTKAAAMAAVEYVRSRGRGLVWVSSREAVEQVMFERSTSETHTSDTRDRIIGAGMLVLDEFGTEREEHGGEVDRWISSRHRRGAPSIFITNAESTSGIDGRIKSRLVTAELFHFKGEDYRRHVRMVERDEGKDGLEHISVELGRYLDDMDGGQS